MVRWLALVIAAELTAAMLVGGCDSPRIVDCAPGQFAQVDGEGWCVYDSRSTVRCPASVPVEHDLSWGDRGCAAQRHEEIPEGLCVAVGECTEDAADGGTGG